MVKLYDGGAYLVNGTEIVPEAEAAKVEALTGKKTEKSEARKGTMAYGIMEAHNTSGNMESTAESGQSHYHSEVWKADTMSVSKIPVKMKW